MMALDGYHIIKRPLITEKAMNLVQGNNTYCFEVHPKATKGEIKEAIEKLFSVTVESVRTLKSHRKMRRMRFHLTKSPEWKKAIVKLGENSRIDLM